MSAALLALAVVLGGGGGPLPDLLIELIGIVLLVMMLGSARSDAGRSGADRLAAATLLVIVLVPFVQLLPLPPGLWRALPGRALAVTIRDAAGAGRGWAPITLDREATVRSALSLVPGIAMFLAVRRAGLPERQRLALIAFVLILASLVLGMLQILGGGGFYLWATAHEGYATGFMVNRNHQADVLLIGVALVPAVLVAFRQRRAVPATSAAYYTGSPVPDWVQRVAAILLMAVLALGVVTTISRGGLALAPFVLIAGLVRVVPRGRSRLIALGIASAIVLTGGAALLFGNDVVQHSAARFATAADDGRAQYWSDTRYAIPSYLPFGSGLGTFVPVYQTVQGLDAVTPLTVNHAHDDYLELLLEAGIAAPIGLLLFAAAIVAAARQPMTGGARALRVSGLIGIALLLAHSIVDYPLRMPALMTVFGMLCGFVWQPRLLSGQAMKSRHFATEQSPL